MTWRLLLASFRHRCFSARATCLWLDAAQSWESPCCSPRQSKSAHAAHAQLLAFPADGRTDPPDPPLAATPPSPSPRGGGVRAGLPAAAPPAGMPLALSADSRTDPEPLGWFEGVARLLRAALGESAAPDCSRPTLMEPCTLTSAPMLPSPAAPSCSHRTKYTRMVPVCVQPAKAEQGACGCRSTTRTAPQACLLDGLPLAAAAAAAPLGDASAPGWPWSSECRGDPDGLAPAESCRGCSELARVPAPAPPSAPPLPPLALLVRCGFLLLGERGGVLATPVAD